MAKQNGTSLYENLIITCSLLVAGLLIVILAGDKIAQIFSNDPSKTISNKSRSNIKKSTPSIITNTTIKIGGEEISSPLETVIKEQLLNGTYVQTSGGSGGNLIETVDVISEYIHQLEKLAGGSISSHSKMQECLNAYEKSIQEYISKDKKFVSGNNDPLLKTINDLDLKIDLAQGGKLALNLLKATKETIRLMPDGYAKKMIKLYVKAVLNLGGSIDYTIDSRTINKIGSKIQKIPAQTLFTNKTPCSSDDDDENNSNLHFAQNITTDEELKSKLEILVRNNELTNSEKQEIAKQLKVYRNGNYVDILSDTYNSDILCESLGGAVKNNNCILE